MIDVPPRSCEDAPDLTQGWNNNAVRRPLWQHHQRKCYLCEGPVALGEFEVDHRVPQSIASGLGDCWLNLFPAHTKCNQRRGNAYPEQGGLLSPGLDGELEARLLQRVDRIDAVEIRACFEAADPDDLYAVNTARELDRVHNPASATTDPAREWTQELLDAITNYYIDAVWPHELRVLRARRRGQPDGASEDELKRTLSRTRPYTMLVRSMVDAGLADLFD